jgi:hypothetical protein
MCDTLPTLIILVLQLVHHFIEGTGIDITDVYATTFLYCLYWYSPTVQLLCYYHAFEVEIEVEVNLRLTVSRPVCPGVRRPSGTRDQFFFFLEISFRQLRLCYFLAPFLTRGRVCNLFVHLYLGLARSVTLGSKSRRTQAIFYCLIWDSPNLEVEVEVNLRPTVSRPLCPGVRRSFGTCDQFFFLLEISFRHPRLCYFVGSVIYLYNCFWALPEQSLLGRSPAELTAIFYCLIWDSANLEGQVPVFISTRNKVAQLYLRALGSLFVASCDSQGLRSRYSNPPPHECASRLQLQLIYDRQSVGQSVLVSGAHPGQSQSHITTDNQSASPSWCQAPIWDPPPVFLVAL